MSDYTPERTGAAFATGLELGRALRDRPLATVLAGLFYYALSAFGLILATLAIFFVLYGGNWALEKYRDWRRGCWIEDCAMHSEIADCRRRYEELRKPSPSPSRRD